MDKESETERWRHLFKPHGQQVVKPRFEPREVKLLRLCTYPYHTDLPKWGKCTVSASKEHTPWMRNTDPKNVQSQATGTWRTKEGGFSSTMGGERELGKLPGGGDLYPVSKADSFSSSLMRAGGGKVFPEDGNWGRQIWKGPALRDTVKEEAGH